MKKFSVLTVAFLLCTRLLCSLVYAADGEGVEISLPRMVFNYRSDEDKRAIIKEELISYSNDYVTANIYKPIINIENKKAEGIMNEKIGKTIKDFENRINELSKTDNEFNLENKLDLKQYVISVNNIVTYNKDNILSLTLSLYSYMGGAHGSTTDISFNFDTNTGNNGSLMDFFGNNSSYKDIILSSIKSTVEENPDMYFKDVVDKLKDIPYDQKFFLTNDNLIVYFDEYAIAPYAAGRVQFKIPYESFPEGINKVHIVEEAPVIKSILIEKAGVINEYICYPHIENMANLEIQDKINEGLEKEINTFIENIKNNSEKLNNINGITIYFVSTLRERDELNIHITYTASNTSDSVVLKDTKSYVINLNSGEVN